MTVGSCSKCPSCQRGLQEQGIVVIYTLTKKVLSKGIVFFVCVPPYPERETVHLQQLLVVVFFFTFYYDLMCGLFFSWSLNLMYILSSSYKSLIPMHELMSA